MDIDQFRSQAHLLALQTEREAYEAHERTRNDTAHRIWNSARSSDRAEDDRRYWRSFGLADREPEVIAARTVARKAEAITKYLHSPWSAKPGEWGPGRGTVDQVANSRGRRHASLGGDLLGWPDWGPAPWQR